MHIIVLSAAPQMQASHFANCPTEVHPRHEQFHTVIYDPPLMEVSTDHFQIAQQMRHIKKQLRDQMTYAPFGLPGAEHR